MYTKQLQMFSVVLIVVFIGVPLMFVIACIALLSSAFDSSIVTVLLDFARMDFGFFLGFLSCIFPVTIV